MLPVKVQFRQSCAAGSACFDADAEARLAVAAGSEGLAQVIAVLGKEYLSEEGTLDRAKVAERIFMTKKR